MMRLDIFQMRFLASIQDQYHYLESVLKAKALVLYCQHNWKALYRSVPNFEEKC